LHDNTGYAILDEGVNNMTVKTDIEREADRMIETVARLMGGQTERMLLTISRGEFGVLMFLSHCESGVTSGAIAQAMRIGPGGVANLLRTLESKGLIAKLQDRNDRRANSVTITEEGRKQLAGRYGQIKRLVSRCLESLGPEDAAALNGILNRVLTFSLTLDQQARP